ncbi:hypothetical protein ABB37_02203 [Leptomonas pyrrhocoris]|uniref:RING-type domain-containing protein n=1 Tax=Leptomonas pyrrhocoris TaxID=157538 RepID=A0A0N0DYF9_LEPPY|nr:hypothetical protein ABB37_02203 [Leptomonas pyrrhocoris]XP_015662548.1 hypothetical protein ABB37_02203 [Leptomonas pyrrhocoris]KPA84108.1 hypothetical protein ABB37_02203 [Leptomonas pyrrhocoris]KPA84109.1 hypothetical protein ABB37_02203 [Leptomonas pyrrhocoris]|eukprot:XP_015662547.1 hypothetical protein ABB37_02203 [Leptomonas pyrrhocoris]
MSSSRRGAGRPPGDTSVSGCVRTLDVYPIKLSPTTSQDADRERTSSLSAQRQRATRGKAPREPVGANTTASAASEAQGASLSPVPPRDRVVTEDDYRLSPQEVQRRVQETLAAQVRSLLEARLQQRLQQARQAEALRQAQQTQAVQAERSAAADIDDRTAPPVLADMWSSNAPEETTDVNVEAAAGAEMLPFTTSRLQITATSSAAADAPPVVDPKKYAETVSAHPYSVVELVRVFRLKGTSDYNRGLFAGLAKRAFTTRSGHLVVNPDLDGQGHVRSAVAGHVWEEQRLQRQQQQQQQRPERSDVHLDAAVNAVASTVRPAPRRLVMRVVGEGDNASFVWTEDDTPYEIVDQDAQWTNRFDSANAAETPLHTALAEVLARKYGKPLTKQQRAEAVRRLRERRRRQRQQYDNSNDKGSTGGRHGAKEKGGSGDNEAQLRLISPAGDGSTNLASLSDAGVAGGSPLLSPTAKQHLLLRDLLPTVYENDVADGRWPPATAAPHAGMAHSRRSTSVSGVEFPMTSPNTWGLRRPPSSRAGLSVSELEHTMSVGEALERHHDRQTRAAQSSAHGDRTLSPRQASWSGKRRSGASASRTSSGDPLSTGMRSGDGRRSGGTATPLSRRVSRGGTPALDLKGDVDHVHNQDGSSSSGAPRTTGDGGASSAATTAGGRKHDNAGKGTASSTSATGVLQALAQDLLLSSPTAAAATTAGKTDTASTWQDASGGASNGDAEHQQLHAFLEHFPEAESHVQLRLEAKNILDELEDMWDEDNTLNERHFPLPQFENQEFHFPGFEDDDERNRQRQRDDGENSRGPSSGSGVEQETEELPEEPVVGFEVDTDALEVKFKTEAAEEYAELSAKRDALLAEAVAQRQLIRDFADDVHFLSVGSARHELSAEQYAIELTRDVNAYARKNYLQFSQFTAEDEAALREMAAIDGEEDEDLALDFLERFGKDRVPTRDVGCQVSDADLCYVDAAVRSTEAQLESLFHHEKALLNAVRLSTVAVANILSFHASLEMESTCHECFFVFDKPRTLWPCGHTFCRGCLSTMYNSRGDLICSECGSVCEVGYTPNLPMELVANYQTVYTRADADAKAASNSAVAEEKEAQTIEGVLRNLLNDLLSTQRNWEPSCPTTS